MLNSLPHLPQLLQRKVNTIPQVFILFYAQGAVQYIYLVCS